MLQGVRDGEGGVWREGGAHAAPVEIRARMHQIVRGGGEARGRRATLSGLNFVNILIKFQIILSLN